MNIPLFPVNPNSPLKSINDLPVQLITLEETPEREMKAKKQLSSYPFEVYVHRFKKQSPGWKGCIDSHLQVYEKNLHQEYLFICEDNIACAHPEGLPYWEYKNLIKFMNECKDWGIIFLGGYILRPWDWCKKTEFPQIYETRNNNHGTVSYIIHQRLFSQIVELHKIKPIDIHFDIYLSQNKCYLYRPFLFYHAHNIQSNINHKSDSWRKVWFHPSTMKILEKMYFDRAYFYTAVLILVGTIWCVWKRLRKN